MSVNNRKYIQSTGMLLNQLKEDANQIQNAGSYHSLSNGQMYTHASANNYHTQSGINSSSIHNLGPAMNQYHQAASYPNMASYTTNHNMPNQFSPGLFPNVPNSMPVTAVAAAAALLSKLAVPNQFNSQPAVPDIMMLPGTTSQQRWQQKQNKTSSSHLYQQQQQQQKQQKHSNVSKKSNISLTSSSSSSSVTAASSSSSASSVTELPETFGLPSNNKILKTSHSKYTSSNTSLQSNSNNIDSFSSKSQTDIQIEDKIEINETNGKSDDIEIIGENYPSISMDTSSSSTSQTTTNVNNSSSTHLQNTMMIKTAFQSNSDENFRNYLAKNYSGGQLAIATKPQCNFISNFACINQILTECDYYNKIKRRKPYSNVRLNKIYDASEDESDEGEDEANNQNDGQYKQNSKIKSKKIIVIDDTNEDMHKPWITPELIKLIKHRNLLQSKINENNGKLDAAADTELMKKFKNLRNKVTKLVKKARKDYLTKYIQESKENKAAALAAATTITTTSVSNATEKQIDTNNELDSELINNLAKNPVPPPPNASTSTTSIAKSPNSSTSTTTTATTSAIVAEKNSTGNITNTSVSAITSQLSSSTNQTTFLQNSNNLMMNLYNSYFNQYLQQYQHQQQQAQQIATAAAVKTAQKDESKKKSDETDNGYDLLQKQAAYYAQQQRAIQTQLETSLSQSAQQLVQEIATMASKSTTNQTAGFIINQQFNHQQHYVIPPQQQPIQMGPFGGLY